jgi:hypothetical protein
MYATADATSNQHDLAHYFRYASAGVHVVADGLAEMRFGEFLIERGAIDRFQLFRALQLQDRHPGVRIGECVAALGYVQISEIERLHETWRGVTTVLVA